MTKTSAMDECWKRIGVWGRKDCPELEQVKHCFDCKIYSRAGRHLFERTMPDGYLDEKSRLIAQSQEEPEHGRVSVFIFRVGREWFGLPAGLLQEVLDMRCVHRIPHRNNSILKGLVNVRGEMELCVSIASLLDLEEIDSMEEQKTMKNIERMLLTRKDGSSLVFPVAEVYGVHRYLPDDLQTVPATVDQTLAAYTTGVIPWKNTHVAVLKEGVLYEHLIGRLS